MLVKFKKPSTVPFESLKVGDAFIDGCNNVFLKIGGVKKAGMTRNSLRLEDCDFWTFHPSEEVVPVVQEGPVSFVSKGRK